MHSTASPHLTVPLTAIAHDWAQHFAAEQANPQKGKRVYLNTLAVWAVHRYLNWLQIDNDLQRSDSWDLRYNTLLDIADLVLPSVGRLECRPVLPNETEVVVPPEVRGDRIGYVAVQLDESLHEGQLLGFLAPEAIADEAEAVALEALQPLDHLLDQVSDLEARAVTPASGQENLTFLTHLGGWLRDQYEIGWQSLEALLGHRTPALAYRGVAVRRAKRLELQDNRSLYDRHLQTSSAQISDGNQQTDTNLQQRLSNLAFVVSLTPETTQQMCIHLHVCSIGERAELPSQLRMQVLTETGEVFREVVSQENDTFLQYEFTGQPGEQFSVEVALGDARIRELFVI
ncbi:DUF1822 family protein [Oscillatoria sp. FACHB-1407]|uniref:DUF1822 family protein n=1 Tax=Oscillatoria sp. FACHB-1407 TaxID=2692847 RepID=UPI00168A3906|nr:DUF1822 family protein [Oscillatoria sp. FACHB-1407]MBD2459753.1 DUF1822 family protein [Oscillatoria sp. FACHB-1407]